MARRSSSQSCCRYTAAEPPVIPRTCATNAENDGISIEWNRCAGHCLQSLAPNRGAGQQYPGSDANAIAHRHSTSLFECVHQSSTGAAISFRWSMFHRLGASTDRWRLVRAATPPPPNGAADVKKVSRWQPVCPEAADPPNYRCLRSHDDDVRTAVATWSICASKAIAVLAGRRGDGRVAAMSVAARVRIVPIAVANRSKADRAGRQDWNPSSKSWVTLSTNLRALATAVTRKCDVDLVWRMSRWPQA